MNMEYPLQLESYFFPHQEVVANGEYQSDGRQDGCQLKSEFTTSVVDGRDDAFSVSVTVYLDREASDNPPYFFHIYTFGIFTLPEDFPEDLRRQFVLTASSILLGAVRERLADLTSRGPWGRYIIPPVPLEFQE